MVFMLVLQHKCMVSIRVFTSTVRIQYLIVHTLYLQHFFEEIDHIRAEVRRNVVVASLDLAEEHGDIAIIKRESSTQQGIQYDPT